jgi:hypothetical protein
VGLAHTVITTYWSGASGPISYIRAREYFTAARGFQEVGAGLGYHVART